jgi:hypothetical protein
MSNRLFDGDLPSTERNYTGFMDAVVSSAGRGLVFVIQGSNLLTSRVTSDLKSRDINYKIITREEVETIPPGNIVANVYQLGIHIED